MTLENDLTCLLWNDLDFFKYDVFKPDDLMVIEVKNMESERGKQVLGRCEVPTHFFARAGGRDAWLDLNLNEKNVGVIRFTSEFKSRESAKP